MATINLNNIANQESHIREISQKELSIRGGTHTDCGLGEFINKFGRKSQ